MGLNACYASIMAVQATLDIVLCMLQIDKIVNTHRTNDTQLTLCVCS